MFGLTKFSLKRPVTVILALITIFFFGLQSIIGSRIELMPEMNFPMMVISTSYPGAGPEDVNELVTKTIEESIGTLSGVKTVSSNSMDNASVVMIQYNYGTNMDKAYLDLKKALDSIQSSLPKNVNQPNIIELDINSEAAISFTVSRSGSAADDLYNYVETNIVPEFEKISSVSQVSISGGRKGYIRIELKQDKLEQYNLNMQTVSNIISAANFTMPVGNVEYGRQKLNLSIGEDYKDIEKLKNIVIPLASGEVIYLSDVANIYEALGTKTSLSRYNGEDNISISVSKQQSATAVDVSRKVKNVINTLTYENPNLKFNIISDTSEIILSAIKSVLETLLLAIVLSMLVLFIFFGDLKASLIVGSSIPISVLMSFTLMGAAGFSMNMISLGSIILGVGMIVDNSIVVLESCFRSKEGKDFKEASLEGTKIVIGSIFGSTATTCVVFLPLALLKGLTGQLFAQLGFTIIFCMLSSFFSAIVIVPLLFNFIKPLEKEKSPMGRFVKWLQNAYRNTVRDILPKKFTVIALSVILLIISIFMAVSVGTELYPATDDGQINIGIETVPNLNIDMIDELGRKIEEAVAAEPEVEKYQFTYGSSGIGNGASASVTAYLKKGRKTSTADMVKKWKKEFSGITDATITVTSVSQSSFGNNSTDIVIPLQGTDYQQLKTTVTDIVAKLQAQNYVTRVKSDIGDAAPIMKLDIDPVKAVSYGLDPSSIASSVGTMLTGSEVMRYTKDGSDISVKLEYPKDAYKTVEQIKDILLNTQSGTKIALSDVAEVKFEDSSQTISRVNKQYQVSITADVTEGYNIDEGIAKAQNFVDSYGLPNGVGRAVNRTDETMIEEFRSLIFAILTAAFLVFIVMAMQFESPRFSLMVMFTIPFSLIGAFGLLYFVGVKISMNSMLGFLMLVGTVVNNGILYVDTVNQLREETDLTDALVEAGAIRLRPILMTTLTTVLSMFPMALALGDAGESLQGLALVNVGGLMASTILSLLLLPTIYQIVDKKRKKKKAEPVGV